MVSPEGNALEFLIKKSELAINAEEARNYNRFQIGDRMLPGGTFDACTRQVQF